ncbi:two-component system, response regulator YcbB [Pelosinus fermentans]|uniref:YcbB domain-containing protein n=2 Tax=Pelosinus TaxID=365348 RepID=I9LJ86_9FIRM|nr:MULTISPECIES: response regulator [Pelosinus]EIW20599.1 YcbB domain-containing protein [Pelosinus fermentans B4]EIW25686.1 response regulator receiver protein [Pelosinus fermentans A11]OAM93409.1 response regulator receiver protein [Pelosinus fermentans DSM 17108]SDQ76778.1 two-component system, response regulator YcbB [Pelosinus fermentans]
MRFFIVDDDEAIRSMLAEIIEDYDLGEVIGEAENGAAIDGNLLTVKAIDILIIDLLMPIRDGIQTVRELIPTYKGGIIMLSQVEDKEMIGNAYSLGVHYYITKPINRLEVLSIIQNVMEHIRLQNVICNIEKNLNVLNSEKVIHTSTPITTKRNAISASGQDLLAQLGMIGESGSKDLLDMLDYLCISENEEPINHEFPSLKDIFTSVAMKKLGMKTPNPNDIKKEAKAIEQRVRRTIFQGITHLASLGIIDYTNPTFEEYTPKFFDFTEIRKIMLNLQSNIKPSIGNSRINIKRFVKVLFIEAKKANNLLS